MSSLSADSGQALDVSADIGSWWSTGQFAHEVLSELGEQSRTTAGHQVTQGNNGALSYGHTGTHKLSEKTSQDRLMETHQSSAQPVK